jgi:hypothetical protein
MNKLLEVADLMIRAAKHVDNNMTDDGTLASELSHAAEALQACDEQWPSDEEIEDAFSDWYETAHTPDTLAGWLDCWKSVTEWLKKRMQGSEGGVDE